MLISKEVEVNITGRNRKIYENKGYKDVLVGKVIKVKLDDLPSSSGKHLCVKCDYCNSHYTVRYCDYKRTDNKILNKDACEKCWHKKRMDLTEIKIKNKEITDKTKKGYWCIEENIKNELLSHINTFGYIGATDTKAKKSWSPIIRGIKNKKLNLEILITELGYDIEKLRLRRENGHFDDFKNLEREILNFIDEYGRFPSQIEINNELGISSHQYGKHGNLDEIKLKMGYDDKYDLVDNNGYINKSKFELIVANYLIAQGISYKREQYPFKQFGEGVNYKSDFTFYTNDEEIHCEVWGGMKSFKNQREFYNYEEVMNTKIKLYKTHNIKLISVNAEIFYYSIDKIKKSLYEIFQPYLNLRYKKVEDRLVSTYTLREMTDIQLFEEIYKYRDKDGYLPTTNKLRDVQQEYLYSEVLKRFGSYYTFADEFNVKLPTRRKAGYWTKEMIYSTLYDFIKNGEYVNREFLREQGLNGLDDVISRTHGGLLKVKLECYMNYLEDISEYSFNEKELKYLENVYFKRYFPNKKSITSEQQKMAKIILEKLKVNNIPLSTLNTH